MVFKSLKNRNILITCGPTWTPIDAMRVISNRSTGELGQTIAKRCLTSGAKVTLLLGPVETQLKLNKAKIIHFRYYDDLLRAVKKELKKRYDIVIHAAAVSDYQLKSSFKKKVSSNLKRLKLNLTPTKKIIGLIKKISPKTYLVGFKLEDNLSQHSLKRKARTLFSEANCDLVIANSLTNHYKGYIVNRNNKILARANNRRDVAKYLVNILRNES